MSWENEITNIKIGVYLKNLIPVAPFTNPFTNTVKL